MSESKMKLSEAIRLGSMLGPQLFMGTRQRSWFGLGPTKRCVLNSAMLAVGEDYAESGPLLAAALRRFDGASLMAPCPGECEFKFPFRVAFILAHLNDTHRWTRERIANWVEAVENSNAVEAQAHEEVGVLVTA